MSIFLTGYSQNRFLTQLVLYEMYLIKKLYKSFTEKRVTLNSGDVTVLKLGRIKEEGDSQTTRAERVTSSQGLRSQRKSLLYSTHFACSYMYTQKITKWVSLEVLQLLVKERIFFNFSFGRGTRKLLHPTLYLCCSREKQ